MRMKKMKLTRKEQIRLYAIKSGALTLTLAELAMPKPKRKLRAVPPVAAMEKDERKL